MRTILDTPGRLVAGDKPVLGIFRTPFETVNADDADTFGMGGIVPKAVRRTRLKEWQHFAIVTETHFVGIAVVDAKFMGVSWCYAFDRREGRMIEHDRQRPFKTPAISRELFDSKFAFEDKGYTVKVHNHLNEHRHTLDFDIAAGDQPAIRGSLTCDEKPEIVQPLIGVIPVGGRRFFYTHKVPCPASGEMEIAGEKIALDPKKDFVILDVHKAYYPYRTWWMWATFAGRDGEGNLLGGNFTRGLHGCTNTYNENGIWRKNALDLLPDVQFGIPDDIMQPWKIASEDGSVDLTFEPEGIRQETIDLKLVVSWYRAPVGRFTGTITDANGVKTDIPGLYGIAEYHRTTW